MDEQIKIRIDVLEAAATRVKNMVVFEGVAVSPEIMSALLEEVIALRTEVEQLKGKAE